MGKVNMADKTAKDTDYLTPDSVLDPVRRYYGGGIPFDPATAPDNPTRAVEFCSLPERDGLLTSWKEQGGGVFVNPPFGSHLQAWLKKIGDEAEMGVTIIALLPVNRFEQGYLHDSVLKMASVACFVRSRVAFLRPSTGEPAKGNPYPSVLWGFNVDVERFTAAFGHLGAVVRVEMQATMTTVEENAILGPPPAHAPASRPACVACGGTGRNSKGGDCLPCSMRETGVTLRTVPFFPETLAELAEDPKAHDPALEGFGV